MMSMYDKIMRLGLFTSIRSNNNQVTTIYFHQNVLHMCGLRYAQCTWLISILLITEIVALNVWFFVDVKPR